MDFELEVSRSDIIIIGNIPEFTSGYLGIPVSPDTITVVIINRSPLKQFINEMLKYYPGSIYRGSSILLPNGGEVIIMEAYDISPSRLSQYLVTLSAENPVLVVKIKNDEILGIWEL